MSGMIELTAYSGKFLGPIAKVLGWIMSGIYDIVLKISGGTINSVPLAIVLMTILIYMCLLPLTIQQQKFSKLSQKMQPELNAIRDKYKNRKDGNESGDTACISEIWYFSIRKLYPDAYPDADFVCFISCIL